MAPRVTDPFLDGEPLHTQWVFLVSQSLIMYFHMRVRVLELGGGWFGVPRVCWSHTSLVTWTLIVSRSSSRHASEFSFYKLSTSLSSFRENHVPFFVARAILCCRVPVSRSDFVLSYAVM